MGSTARPEKKEKSMDGERYDGMDSWTLRRRLRALARVKCELLIVFFSGKLVITT
jgi:hypothetical protein